MFDACTRGYIAHIDTIFKLLPHTHQHVDMCVSFGFLVINVCNQGEHYEMPCISFIYSKQTELAAK